MTDNLQDVFLQLVRLGIGHTTLNGVSMPDTVDWNALKEIADKQGLLAVVLDGIELLKANGTNLALPDKAFMIEWIGEVLNDYEYFHNQCGQTIAQMARFYGDYGIKLMVLKGYACSLDWPRPEHRPSGDIDIWQFGRQKEADALLASKKEIEVDSSHHYHTVFYWGEFMVENHYDFINTHSRRSNRKLEQLFKTLGRDDTHFIDLYGEKVYLPSPNLHSLFLIRHLAAHFTSANIILRQVLDWAFFVEKHSQEVDWDWLLGVLEEYHLKEFFGLINAICVNQLGFSAELFPLVGFDSALEEKVMSDILEPAYTMDEPAHLIPRLAYKYRRWQGNAWKQRICYKESRWSAFWTGIWAHIIKPSSI